MNVLGNLYPWGQKVVLYRNYSGPNNLADQKLRDTFSVLVGIAPFIFKPHRQILCV
jgi:hypothetical protein